MHSDDYEAHFTLVFQSFLLGLIMKIWQFYHFSILQKSWETPCTLILYRTYISIFFINVYFVSYFYIAKRLWLAEAVFDCHNHLPTATRNKHSCIIKMVMVGLDLSNTDLEARIFFFSFVIKSYLRILGLPFDDYKLITPVTLNRDE